MPGQPSLTTGSTVTLEVLRSGESASIFGGDERIIGSDTPLLLDASASYDMDYPSAGSEILTFDWSCMEESPAFGNPCGKFFKPSGPFIDIAAGALTSTVDKVYIYTVRVSNDENSVSVVQQRIYAQMRVVPALVIPKISSKMRQFKRIVVNASVTSNDPVWISWSSPGIPDSVLEEVTATPIAQQLPAGTHQLQMGITPDERFAPGVSYRLVLSAEPVRGRTLKEPP